MVQTITRALKIYVQDLNQQDWDEYAERLTFAINTAQYRVRGDTQFYLIHGWDPRSIPWAVLAPAFEILRDWRYQIQRYYTTAREQVNVKQKETISDQADRHNEEANPHQIEAGSQVWMYLDRVKEGYARKLAHLWHGPFRVVKKINEYSLRLEIAGMEYRLFPIVHVPKLKLVKEFPDRPQIELTVPVSDRLGFDENLLPEDSWTSDLGADEYEVEKITDLRTGRRTRYGRIYRDFLVHWKGYEDPSWVDEADLNCETLLQDFLPGQANRNRSVRCSPTWNSEIEGIAASWSP